MYLKFNKQNYYQLDASTSAIDVEGKTYKEYKFKKYSIQLNNVGCNAFIITGNFNDLDMNKFTILKFDNGDTFRIQNFYLWFYSIQDPTYSQRTKNDNSLNFSSPNNKKICAYYFKKYVDESGRILQNQPIVVNWVNIEINAD